MNTKDTFIEIIDGNYCCYQVIGLDGIFYGKIEYRNDTNTCFSDVSVIDKKFSLSDFLRVNSFYSDGSNANEFDRLRLVNEKLKTEGVYIYPTSSLILIKLPIAE